MHSNTAVYSYVWKFVAAYLLSKVCILIIIQICILNPHHILKTLPFPNHERECTWYSVGNKPYSIVIMKINYFVLFWPSHILQLNPYRNWQRYCETISHQCLSWTACTYTCIMHKYIDNWIGRSAQRIRSRRGDPWQMTVGWKDTVYMHERVTNTHNHLVWLCRMLGLGLALADTFWPRGLGELVSGSRYTHALVFIHVHNIFTRRDNGRIYGCR